MKFLKHGSQKILKFVMVMILAISCNVMGTVCFAEETQGEFIQVSAGESHCVALKADGTVWAWGRGLEGQLGNGKFKNSTIPVKVKGLKNISKVSAGGKHNLALDEEGRVWAWGYDSYGQLGIGSHENRAEPVEVDYSKYSAMSAYEIQAGSEHSLILTNTAILSFGRNKEGQLGNSDFGYEKQRVGVVKGYSSKNPDWEFVCSIYAAGNRSYLGIRHEDGEQMAYLGWGEDITAEPEGISSNNVFDRCRFAAGGNNYAVADLYGYISYYENGVQKNYELEGLREVELGYDFGLVLNRTGDVYTFGKSFFGAEQENSKLTKVNINNIKDMSAGKDFAIFIDNDGKLWGLGKNEYGQLGNGTTKNADEPVQLKTTDFTINDTIVGFAQGLNHSLFIKKDGTVWAFGKNEYGQLGDGSYDDSDSPVQVEGLDDVIAVSAGNDFSTAIKADGTVWAWGKNNRGQLGNGTNVNSNIPVKVSLEYGGASISAGGDHVLMIDTNGIAWAWGANNYGQLGDKTYLDRSTPVKISLTCIKKVSAGQGFSLLLKTNSILYTFGSNSCGQLGRESKYNNKPVQIADSVMDISAGSRNTVAVKLDGTVYTCGFNYEYALGLNSYSEKVTTLTQIPELKNVSRVFTGECSGIALTKDGKVLAWGDSTVPINNMGVQYSNNSRIRVLKFEKIKDICMNSGSTVMSCVLVAEDESVIDIYGNKINVDERKYHPQNGEGTEENPYLITNIDDFYMIKNNLEANYKMTSDIDFGKDTVKSIGTEKKPFRGTFDGNGFCLSNFNVRLSDSYATFGSIFAYTENANIKNVTLTRVNVVGSSKGDIGALVGFLNGGSVLNCSMYTVGQNIPSRIIARSALIYKSEGNAEVKDIDFANLEEVNGFEKNVTITKDENYNFVLTSEGSQYVKAIVYSISYDAKKISLISLCNGTNTKKENGIIVDKDIDVISHSNGVLKFRVNRDEKNWCGNMANLEFKALDNGQTTIKFNAE